MKKSCKISFRLAVALSINCAMIALIAVAPATSHAQTQSEMNRQTYKEYEIADAALNKAYKRTMSKLSKKAQAKLRVSQRAWIKFRDREVEIVAEGNRGGTIAPMEANLRATELTKLRTKYLQRYKAR